MRLFNKKATFDYVLLDKLEAGVQLIGAEAKSVALGQGSLEGAFVKFLGSEAYLVNAQIPLYKYARLEGYDPRRSRKLLLHKKELLRLRTKIEADRLTVVPVVMYTIGRKVKLEIATARGKKQYEKREILRRETQRRELEREYRGKVK